MFFFSVESACLNINNSDFERVAETHDRFLLQWDKLGLFVFPGEDLEKTKIVATLKELPLNIRKRWQLALRKMRKCSGPENWDGIDNVESIDQLEDLKGVIDLAVVEECRAVELGLDPGERSMIVHDGRVEICRLASADVSKTVQAVFEHANSTIKKDAGVSATWRERFHLLGKHSRAVVVVDRYLLSRSWERKAGYSSLRKLLVELANSARGCSLEIYSATFADGLTAADACQLLDDELRGLVGRGIRSARLHLVEDGEFAKSCHARHIRFDQTVFSLDSGLEFLEGSRVWRDCDVHLKSDHRPAMERESVLRGLSICDREWPLTR